eukprot:c13050_g1_i2.p1 GENE.c13050_g1_i2~~c13050_g1_i2.p1  ORF type:complete len:257 (-),score=21.06 c13050_g1_i2:35-805(-)
MKFGRIVDIDLHVPVRPPAFCFVTFADSRDADDAVYERHGYEFAGERLRVEFSRMRGGDRDRDRHRSPPRRQPPRSLRRGEFVVRVSNLPRSVSWQDLKDHMRDAGDICFTDVFRDGTGVVEFSRKEDMEYAIRKLDRSEIRNPFDRAEIRVREDRRSGSPRSDSRSPSRDRSRERDRSRDRSRDGSRDSRRDNSRDRSPRDKSPKKRSPSRSPSPSPPRDANSKKRHADLSPQERDAKRSRQDESGDEDSKPVDS